MYRESDYQRRLPLTCSCGEDLSTLEAEDYLRYGCQHVPDLRKQRRSRRRSGKETSGNDYGPSYKKVHRKGT